MELAQPGFGAEERQSHEPKMEDEDTRLQEEYQDARSKLAISLRDEFGLIFNHVVSESSGLMDAFNKMHKYFSLLGREYLQQFYTRFDSQLLNDYLSKRIVYKKFLEQKK